MRTQSQSLKVSNWLAKHTESLGFSSEIIDLHALKLPLFDVGETDAPHAEKIMKALENADAAVFVSPEWQGSMSHGLANMLMYVDKQLAHKPVMLVGVAAGRGGHYPLMQMRITSYKNSKFVVIPENLLVQDVGGVLNDHDAPRPGSADESVRRQADYALKILGQYAQSLQQVRSSGIVDHDAFSHGV